MGSATINIVETFVVEYCINCGMSFAITNSFRQRRLDDHKLFYCPQGHSQYFVAKSATEMAREEAQRQRERAERLASQIKQVGERLEGERRAHSATKGQLTKTRKRAERAMCPAPGCKRSFANVARHVANQHSELIDQQSVGHSV